MGEEKAREFMEIYSNLPVKTRREIIVVVDDEPYSWNVARKEIENKTKIGNKIISKLIELRIL